jgi:alpha-L-fucosidase 2
LVITLMILTTTILYKEGNLKEWTDDFEVMDPYHRHISHIYGIFPGKLFSLTGNPKVFEAAVKAIHKRREGGFSQYATWSHAWFACCFARIGHGDEALESIKDLMKSGLCSNFLTLLNDWRDQGFTAFFTKYKLLQTEALLGATAAIAEMLVQSFDDEIQILPALPHDWSGGSVKGLRAYGGFEISIVWKDQCIERVELTSSNGGDCLLRFCRPFVRKAFLSDSAGDTVCAVEAQVLRFSTVAGDEHRIITCPE